MGGGVKGGRGSFVSSSGSGLTSCSIETAKRKIPDFVHFYLYGNWEIEGKGGRGRE